MGTTQATEGTQLIDEVQFSIPPEPPNPRTSTLVPSSIESSPPSEMEEDFGMQKLALSEDPPQEMSQVLGKSISPPYRPLPFAYTQVAFETQWTGPGQAQVSTVVSPIAESNTGTGKGIEHTGIDMETLVVSCECDVAADAEDYSICLCEGPCKRWVHLWSVSRCFLLQGLTMGIGAMAIIPTRIHGSQKRSNALSAVFAETLRSAYSAKGKSLR